MNRKLQLIVLVIALTTAMGARANYWIQMAGFGGGARGYGVSFSIGAKGYFATGWNGVGDFQDLWEYDSGTNTWAQMANLPGFPRSQAVGFSIGAKGYVGTGDGFTNDFYEYDPVANTWAQKANFGGSGRDSAFGFSIGSKGYIGGGYSFIVPPNLPLDFWEYDPALNTWTQKANIPAHCVGGTGFSIGTKGYAGLGSAGTNFWSYDPSVNTWSSLASYPGSNIGYPASFTIGTKGYVCTGSYLPDLYSYDTTTNAWTQMANYGGVGRQGASGFAIGPKGYVGCGYVGMNNFAADFWQFTPEVCPITGQVCDDGNVCTINDQYDITCQCFGTLQDSDGDGTCDAFDSCPMLFGQVGDPCVDNIPCTVNEVIDANCNCTGITPDSDGDGFIDCFDNCPYIFGLTGYPCNDNNPFTSNDVIDPNCQCTGTCNGAPVTLTLTTDINGAQTTWNIVLGGTNTIVCSGVGFLNSSTFAVNCCLANGCYDLRVYDSFGDGINPGGYVLTDANSYRIIDNSNNGPNFSTLSEVLDATSTPVSFCIPTGTDALVPASCDQTGLTINSVIQSQINANVSAQYGITNATSGYQFWIFGPNATYSRRLFQSHAAPGNGWPIATPVAQRAAYLKLSTMNNAPIIPGNVLLNVRVRSRVAGVYGAFGPACRLTIGNVINCATTQLTTTPTPLVSCGATGLNRLFGVIWSNNVPLANKYQFEFVNANTLVFLRNIASPTRNLNMTTWGNAIALPNCFTPYNIRVRVSFNNGVTYCPWGPVCQVSYTCPPENGRAMETAVTDHSSLSIWPNPNDGKQLAIALSGLDANADHIDLVIFDAFGKEAMAHSYPASNGEVSTTIDFDHALAAGVYVVRITSREQQFTQRMIIQ